MIVVSFALPGESKDFIARLAGVRRIRGGSLPVFEGALDGREIVVMHCGMGMGSATRRVAEFLEGHVPVFWIAAGFGGALSAELKIGDMVAVQNFSDPALLGAVEGLDACTGALITVKQVVETVECKKDLARHTGALVVDMETAGIHRVCHGRGVRMLAVRAISDTAEQELPVRAEIWFDLVRQRPRAFRLVVHLLAHPGKIGPFTKFVSGINAARANLADYLVNAVKRLPEK